jgi:hypothetical protein
MREETATYRLTRQYLAEVRPGVDPDQASFEQLCILLGPEPTGYAATGGYGPNGFLPWLKRHPDQRLVAQYWRENHAAVQDTFDQLTGRPRWN